MEKLELTLKASNGDERHEPAQERGALPDYLSRFIVENSHVGFLVIDDAYRAVYANAELERITGYALSELIGNDFRGFLAKDSQKQVTERYRSRQQGAHGEKIPGTYEVAIHRKDGKRLTVEITVALTRSPEGTALTVVQVFDVSARKRMASELAKSREKYQDLFKNVFDLIYLHDLEGRIFETNSHYINLMGGSRDSIINRNIREFIPQRFHPAFEAYLERIVQNGIDEGVATIEVPGAKERQLEYRNSLIIENGTPVGVRGSARDITDRRQAKKILVESEQHLREVIEGSPIPVMVINRDHMVTQWNEACEKLTGIRRETVVGTDRQWQGLYSARCPLLSDLVLNNASKQTFRRHYGRQCRQSRTVSGAWEAEGFFPDLNEKGRWLFFTAAPLRDGRGNITGAMETWIDITEKKRAEKNLLKMHEALEQKVKERTQALEEANVALQVLLKKRESDRMDLGEQMVVNIREIISPYIERMKQTSSPEMQKVLLEIIERNLEDLASPFIHDLSKTLHKLTPSEIQIINLIKLNKTTKEIAGLLNCSARTVDTHRNNIRKKLGIKNQKINLKSYLISMGTTASRSPADSTC